MCNRDLDELNLVTVVWLGLAGNLEYEYLENGYLECIIISKKMQWGSKKNDGNLEFNLEDDNLDKRHSIRVVSVGSLG